MSRLKGRVARMGSQAYKAPQSGKTGTGNSSPGGAPAQSPGIQSAAVAKGTASPVTAPTGGSAASPPSVMIMPLQRVVIQRTSSQYVTAGMEDLTPIWTTDGAAVPASARGSWGQLRAAGRP